MEQNYSLAVIMTVHNRKETTLACLNNLSKCRIPARLMITVYLMDDGSTDGTQQAVESNFPSVHILHGNGSLYWNHGMIECWKTAINQGFDYYMWLNDDTCLYENAIEELFEVYSQLPKLSVVVGQTCSTTNPNQHTYGGWIKGKVIYSDGEIKKVETMNGNVTLIPQLVVSKIGILCSFYRHQFGDHDYGYSCNRNGIGVYTTRCFIGTCDQHTNTPKCFDLQYSLWNRIKHLYSPVGCNPIEYSYFCFRTRPRWIALKSSVYGNYLNHYHCFFGLSKLS